MTEIKCPKCGSTNAYNFQDKENWYRCRDCLEFLYANEHGVVDCETLGKAAHQYAISHNITVTSPLVAGTRTFFDEGGNDITSKIVDDWLRGLTMAGKSIDDWIELLSDRSKHGDIGEYFHREQCAELLKFLKELKRRRADDDKKRLRKGIQINV